MNGLLLIDKPYGWTSFDAVAKVRGVLRAQRTLSSTDIASGPLSSSSPKKIKVGHTGTLDPLATGLLVLAIGAYTKKVPELTKQDKTYVAAIKLGFTSTTEDAEGEITPYNLENASTLTPPMLARVLKVLDTFLGESEQVPPQFSAIKVGGVRSYKAARSGIVVAHQPRKINIYSITDVRYEYPVLEFTTHVGSGTYIRSLARDIGERLGTGAYLSALRRTQVGDFQVDAAISPENINSDQISQNLLA